VEKVKKRRMTVAQMRRRRAPRRLRGRSWRRNWLRKMDVRLVVPKKGAAQAVALKTKADHGIIQMKQRPQKSQRGAVS